MSRLSGTRVLLVDDDAAQTEVVSEILSLEGMEVQSASEMQDIDRLLAERPDVVLLDLHGVDADAVAAAIKRMHVRAALLVLSGDLKLADHAKSLGADGYLAKPYDLEDLLEAVARVVALRRGLTPNPDPLGAPGMGPG
jgi:DNA-binding NtrC family response regulator